VSVLMIVFADLAGFTAATDAHGDDTAADLAARLVQCAQAALGRLSRRAWNLRWRSPA
jgi:class 3 adenylate cyclase